MATTRTKFDWQVVENFLDAPACARLIDEIRHAKRYDALTYGKGDSGSVDNRVRRVQSATLGRETVAWVASKLDDYLPCLRKHFNLAPGGWEDPQFLRYATGDFFVAHQDGNTGLMQLDSDRLRRVSVSIFLNTENDMPGPDCYCGGSLVFTDRATNEKIAVRGEPGKLIAFRSELTHEVTPVTWGERFAIVTWYRIVS